MEFMDIETGHIIWNVILTLIVGPFLWVIKSIMDEQKRQDILINKTREEMARDYVSKQELSEDINRILDAIEKLNDKLDRINEAAAKEFRL
tara:strand:- start:736 stop:1008 length:273 start_codon:yes stop_codon:yes gene_type:complete